MSIIYKFHRRSDSRGQKKSVLQGFLFLKSKDKTVTRNILILVHRYLTEQNNTDTVKTEVKFKQG